MQSANYVPGVSGWKMDRDSFELNAGNRVNEACPRKITVTVGDWGVSELPSSALAQVAFMADQVERLPEGVGGEWEIIDDSYEPGFSDIRLKLTYQRLETAEEVAKRLRRTEGASLSMNGGVITVSVGGVPISRLGPLEEKGEEPAKQSFAVDGDQLFISQALINPAMWSVKMQLNAQGQYIAAGAGLGADDSAKEQAEQRRESIRQVIREELRPGGLLYRR